MHFSHYTMHFGKLSIALLFCKVKLEEKKSNNNLLFGFAPIACWREKWFGHRVLTLASKPPRRGACSFM